MFADDSLSDNNFCFHDYIFWELMFGYILNNTLGERLGAESRVACYSE